MSHSHRFYMCTVVCCFPLDQHIHDLYDILGNKERETELSCDTATVQHKANTYSPWLLTRWALCITFTTVHRDGTLSTGKEVKYQQENLKQKTRFDDPWWRGGCSHIKCPDTLTS